MMINIRKLLVAAYALICLSGTLNAQDIMSIHEQGGQINNFNIYSIDSVTFNNDNISKVIRIYNKTGPVSEFDVSTIDSLTFEKRVMSGKQGFVVIRVDDVHPSSEMIPMSNVLDKFGFKMVCVFNPSLANKDAVAAIKLIQSNGHEITDHTPNHTTAYADLKTGEQVKMFVGRPGVERIVGLRVYFDWEYPDLTKCVVANDSIITTSRSGVIKGDLTNVTAQDQIYTTEFGWVLLKNISATQATIIHAKSRQELIFTKSSKEQLYKVNSYSVFLTVDGMKSLMLASQLMFEYLGIDYYKYWCMCGGAWAMGRGDVIRDAGASLGYIGGSEQSHPNGNIPLTYNQSNTLSKWASQVETINSELTLPAQLKRIIANEVSKHRGIVDTGHMWYKDPTYTTLFTGTDDEKFNEYLKNLEEILQFCYDNNIPVITYKDVINVLYETIPDSLINVMPPLYNDLTSQGFPDGYELDTNTVVDKNNGVTEDHGYSLKRNDDGRIFAIENIGGFEKGENTFSSYVRGTNKGILSILVKNVAGDKTYQTIKIPVSDALNSFVKVTAKINIPNDVDMFSLWFYISKNNIGQDFYISGMYIGKKKE